MRLGIWLLLLSMTVGCANNGEVVPLSGAWDYRDGFDEAWLSETGGSWKQVNLPEHFSRLPEFKNGTGTITVRHTLPAGLANLLTSGQGVAFNSGQISDTSRLYFNSRLVSRLGSEENNTSGHNLQFLQALPFDAVNAKGENHIFVVVRSVGNYRFWMKGPVIEIGPTDAIFHNFSVRVVSGMFLIASYLMIGFYHLLLLVRRREDIYNLYFGIFSTSIALWICMNSDIAQLLSSETVILRRRVDQISLMFVGPAFLMFLESYFNRRHSKIGITWSVLCMAIATLDTVAPFKIMLIGLQTWMASMAVGGPLIVYTIVREVFKKNRDAFFMTAGVVLLIGGAGVDIMIDRGILKGSFISQYTLMLFDAGIAIVLANRYVRVQRQIEFLNQDLENKVNLRTAELQASLTTVQELKKQQDGDYFLTSQLIAPLCKIHANDSDLHISVVVKQKKAFQYKKWFAELGGDLVTSHEIELRGVKYTVIMNADAMGKSMQGAGGALVLGSAVKSIITRTNSAPELKKGSPEQWLKQCYLDLQSLFVSFDGTMIVSLILGLIEKKTGLFIWINAEHPRCALYRNGLASFFKKEHILRKLGVDDESVPFAINSAQLRAEDIVFLGSDGRDDIRLTRDDGESEMNEDEGLFLDLLVKSQGSLDTLVSLLASSGEITDDLTLIRIAYREDAPLYVVDQRQETLFQSLLSQGSDLVANGNMKDARSILERARAIRDDHPALLDSLLSVCRKSKDFEAAKEIVDRYMTLRPANNSLLHVASAIHSKIGNLEHAVDYGERCRMRDPGNIKNTVHLADLYLRLANLERASTLLNLARAIDPGSTHVKNLAEKLAPRIAEDLRGI
ncbi:MAG: SpoIIE family protein phosphatase [Spirochaetia bacterium]|nr:SpoIIE family protein phosphatase [Spirochaetia bacterium]